MSGSQLNPFDSTPFVSGPDEGVVGHHGEAAPLRAGSGREFIGVSHGRVNLIGEHTDYNDGFVLPSAIPQATRVRLSPALGSEGSSERGWEGEAVATVTSLNIANEAGEAESASWKIGEEAATGAWSDYPKGVVRALLAAGHRLGGFSATIESTVPLGSGLSSSAAMAVALLRALRDAFGLALDDRAIARVAQAAESDFVGARVGIMDPMACSLARQGEALLIDTRSLDFERVPIPEFIGIAVLHSGLAHRNASGGYNLRRAQCEEACRTLGISSLRELSAGDLVRAQNRLPEVLFRRARHVVNENARVHQAARALAAGDGPMLGSLFRESHLSQTQDYEVSTPEIDLLVRLVEESGRAFGARLTGGGFGGSIAIAVPLHKGLESDWDWLPATIDRYRSETGLIAHPLVLPRRLAPLSSKASPPLEAQR